MIEDVYGIRKKKEVMDDTWGHLAPDVNRVYGGYILYTLGCYGDITCIQTHFRELPDSPWFYDDLHSFMCYGDEKEEEQGIIYLFLGSYCRDRKEKFIGITQRMTAGILRDKIEKETPKPKPNCREVKNALKGLPLRIHSVGDER